MMKSEVDIVSRRSLTRAGHMTVFVAAICQLLLTGFVASLSSSPGTRCRFPMEWRGRYFQSGLGEIFIRDSLITTKGRCIEQSRDYFLLHNRENNCNYCLLLLSPHFNVIQYKESYCSASNNLKTVCSQIRVETPLYTIIREHASVVRCPLNGGAYYFAYNDLVHGFCPQALSYAKPCAGNTKYQLQFNHCVEGATFNGRDLVVECLATWKDGSEMFIYGRLNGVNLNDKEEKYRCFKYHHIGNEIAMSMSADATCRGLRTANDGPFLMEFTRDNAGWPDPACQFPDWLRDITWSNFDNQWKFSVNDDLTVLSNHDSRSMTSSKQNETKSTLERRSEFRCRQKISSNENEVVIHSMALHNCVSKFQCLKFRKLDKYVIELNQGSMTDHDSGARCHSDVYDNVQLIFPEKVRLAAMPAVNCPLRGIHYTATVDGCMHRINVGCNNTSSIDVDSSCTVPRNTGITLDCLITWSDDHDDSNATSFIVVRHKNSNVIDCMSFRRAMVGGKAIVVFGSDSRCSTNNTTSRGTHQRLTYNVLRYDLCRRDVMDTVTSTLHPTMTSSSRISALVTRAAARMASTPTAASDYVIYDDVYDENDDIVTTKLSTTTKTEARSDAQPTTRSMFSNSRRFTFPTSSVAILARRSSFTAVAQQQHVMPLVTSSSVEKFRKPAKSRGSRRHWTVAELFATGVMSFIAFSVR